MDESELTQEVTNLMSVVGLLVRRARAAAAAA